MNRKKLLQIENRIKKIKSALTEIGEMRPGSLTEQYKDPVNKKGAYYQLSYTLNMKSRTDYIRKGYVKIIRRQVENYKKFKQLNEAWIRLSIEHSTLQMKLDDDR